MELSRPPNKPGNWCVVDTPTGERRRGRASPLATSASLVGNVPLIMHPMRVHPPLDPLVAGAHPLYGLTDKERAKLGTEINAAVGIMT